MRVRFVLGFLVLFVAYQAPEGVGQRALQSFAAQAALLLAFFPIAFAVGRWTHGSATAAYALERSRFPLRTCAALWLLALLAKAAAIWIGARAGAYQVLTAPRIGMSVVESVPAALAITFFPSLAEDIVTRGFWYRLPTMRWSPVQFVIVSSGIYVGNHIFRLAAGPLEWIMLFTFGLVYATALVRTGSLWAAVALHWGWNFANAIQDSVAVVSVESTARSRIDSAAIHIVLLIILVYGPWPWNHKQPESATSRMRRGAA